MGVWSVKRVSERSLWRFICACTLVIDDDEEDNEATPKKLTVERPERRLGLAAAAHLDKAAHKAAAAAAGAGAAARAVTENLDVHRLFIWFCLFVCLFLCGWVGGWVGV